MRFDEKTRFEGRISRFVEETITPALYPERIALDVSVWRVPDEPVPFDEARAATYEPFVMGSPWGVAWSTEWFHVTGEVPAAWRERDLEVVVDLGFHTWNEGGQAEGLAYRPDGSIVKAIEPYNRYLRVDRGTERVDLYIEAASNPDAAVRAEGERWGNTWRQSPYTSKEHRPPTPVYVFRSCDLAVRDHEVAAFAADVDVLWQLALVLPETSPRRASIVAALARAIDVCDPDDLPGTVGAGRAVLAPVLASPAGASSHTLVATGHAHIDSAWLWPVRETIRKCARTWSNVLELLEEHEDLTFSASSAQQYRWMKDHYPQVWERIRAAVADGRFIPVGGMWVESDTNMPGSEAMARQFVAGQRFFREELGVTCPEVWLPDSFGYSGALPQIARAAGARWFLTQKLSWNETNVMPHHSFTWEGIDGSRIFTHFPPVDSYVSALDAEDLDKAERQYSEAGHGTRSLIPFGYGDGGGGPTREMVARAERQADLEGSPRVVLGNPRDFFAAAEAELPDPSTWTGEMYLETHRGTYTSQVRTKQGNRRSEHALHAAELWAATAAVREGAPYPYDDLERIWHVVLLQQFHDILPGSSIAWVHREAEAGYGRVLAECAEIVDGAVRALVGEGDLALAANATPFALDSVAPMAIGAHDAGSGATGATSVVPGADGTVLDNGLLRVVVDPRGLVTSLRDLVADREVVAAGAAALLFQVHGDRPTMYEAWDIDAAYRRTVEDLRAADSVEILAPDAVRVSHTYRSSTVAATLRLPAGARHLDVTVDVDWHEARRLLKLAVPVDVKADAAASETQFGHVVRPTHTNTTWDEARYETVAHRWLHVGEEGYGVAVVNDSTYGYDVRRTWAGERSAAATTIRASVIHGPKFPDPDCDMGEHTMRYRILPGATRADALRHAWDVNLPTTRLTGARAVAPLLDVTGRGVVVQTVKLAEDRSGDVVVRLYESDGGRTRASIRADFEHVGVAVTDLLEEPTGEAATVVDGAVELELRPFQIVTLRYAR
ncbi:alpha-mannosidase [Salana multivorans]|uniref:Alpha-mannosidase n=1 Tax=Salana multivorans TaxID=120377 RepID=A0A3N2DAR7_9MICO|nr:glycoside hydrolase family 38 C-terminal domain-containing protein [Salana multivorans]ROR96889.1 alpha-mannosidase [Salana multivorans]